MSKDIKILLIALSFIAGILLGVLFASYAFIRLLPAQSSDIPQEQEAVVTNSDETEKQASSKENKNNTDIKEKTEEKPTSMDSILLQESDDAPYSVKAYKEQYDIVDIAVVYPTFENEEINTSIVAFVQDTVADFRNKAINIQYSGISEMFLEGNFQTYYYGEDIVSVHFFMLEYTGGAHPYNYQVGKTFNMKTGQELELTDVLAGSPSMGAVLEQMIENTLIETFDADVDIEWIIDGVDQMDLFYEDWWTVDSTGITFHFPPYQVAAYAAGPQDVTLLWEDIQNWVTDTFKQ